MIRHIGYACINLTLKDEGVTTNRTCRMKNFSLEKVSYLILQNVWDLKRILAWNNEHNIKFFRISSDIFPFMDHPELGYELKDLPCGATIIEELRSCGEAAQRSGMRLSTHPGPYTCLASPNEAVRNKSIQSIEMHTTLGKALGLKDFDINIHVGGTYGDKKETAARFIQSFRRLSEQSQKWLTVENDDKESMWSVHDLYTMIHPFTNIPIVFDMHHWKFCHKYDMKRSGDLALLSWANIDRVPKMHYSESAPNKKATAHSDFINNEIPDLWNQQFDVMVEAKQKDLTILKYRADANNRKQLAAIGE